MTWSPTWDTSDPTLLSMQSEKSNLTRLSNLDCMKYVTKYQSVTSNIAILVNETAAENANSSLVLSFQSPNPPKYFDQGSNWGCAHYSQAWIRCTEQIILRHASDWIIEMDGKNYTAQDCLISQQADNNSRCGLHFSSVIFGIVCASLVVSCLLISLTAFICRERRPRNSSATEDSDEPHCDQHMPLVTLGDALAAFLERPHQSHETTSSSPEKKKTAGEMPKKKRQPFPTTFSLKKQTWNARKSAHWGTAASMSEWIIFAFL